MAVPAGRVAAAVRLGGDPHRHPREHDEAADADGGEDEAGAPWRETGGERTGGGHAEQAAGGDEVVGGGVEAGTSAGEVEQPAAGDRDHQPADPEVGAGARRRPRRPPARERPARARRRWPRGRRARPGGPTRRSVPMAVSRPRPTGPATSAYTPMPATMPTVMHSRPSRSPEWPPSAEASPPMSRSTNVGGGGAAFRRFAGARLVPPLRGRWVVATVPTTVPAAPPATGATASAVDFVRSADEIDRRPSGAAGRWGSGWCPGRR